MSRLFNYISNDNQNYLLTYLLITTLQRVNLIKAMLQLLKFCESYLKVCNTKLKKEMQNTTQRLVYCISLTQTFIRSAKNPGPQR